MYALLHYTSGDGRVSQPHNVLPHIQSVAKVSTRNSWFSWGLILMQQFQAVLDTEDCDNRMCFMLIRKYGSSVICYDNELNLRKMSSSVRASAFSSNTCSSSKNNYQMPLRDFHLRHLLAICYIMVLTLMPTVRTLNHHLESISLMIMTQLHCRGKWK